MEAPSSPHEVTLVIRSPSTADDVDFRLRVPLATSTIGSLKARLAAEHPDHPPPSEQRLIFAGQLLRDDAKAIDLLRQVSPRSRGQPAGRARTASVCAF
eukprot:scaffold63079_cov26-Tisochrysis_lutea.AAC.1